MELSQGAHTGPWPRLYLLASAKLFLSAILASFLSSLVRASRLYTLRLRPCADLYHPYFFADLE